MIIDDLRGLPGFRGKAERHSYGQAVSAREAHFNHINDAGHDSKRQREIFRSISKFGRNWALILGIMVTISQIAPASPKRMEQGPTVSKQLNTGLSGTSGLQPWSGAIMGSLGTVHIP